jgi:hypothetical protein
MGIIVNIPNTVLIIVSQFLGGALRRRFLVERKRVAAIQSSMTTLATPDRRHHRPAGDL